MDAEGEYSRGRLRAIAQEWYKDYPRLPDCAKSLLTNRSTNFRIKELANDELQEWALSLACDQNGKNGRLTELAKRFVENSEMVGQLRREVASIFYRTGIVGLKTTAFDKPNWAGNESSSISSAEIDEETVVYVHPGLWRVLGTSPFS